MPNTQSLTVLHYGLDYLPYAIKSIYDQVDRLNIFYTPTPSHGHRTAAAPIEEREDLLAAAYNYDPDNKIHWFDTAGLVYEGQQRDLALATVQQAGAEIVVVLDYDEVWPRGMIESCLDYVQGKPVRQWMVNMVHFWRSFNWACYDHGWPVRIINLAYPAGVSTLPANDLGRVCHFGYAIRDEIMRYKWEIHGHKAELRPGWLDREWTAWPPVINCHPTNGTDGQGRPFWSPVRIDKTTLPEFMRQHPFYNLDKIE